MTYYKGPNHHNADLEKSKAHILVEIIEYVPNSVLSKTIIKKTQEMLVLCLLIVMKDSQKRLPFDSFAQIIDGKAEIVIDGVSNQLSAGQGIVIPAHRSNIIKANERFKMILTIIKSGYED